jgi:hypothetical protein
MEIGVDDDAFGARRGTQWGHFGHRTEC